MQIMPIFQGDLKSKFLDDILERNWISKAQNEHLLQNVDSSFKLTFSCLWN